MISDYSHTNLLSVPYHPSPHLLSLVLCCYSPSQDLEDRMLLALHGCVVTAGEIVPDDGEYPVRILHQKYPEMMIQVMDLFMGVKAVIDA